MRLELFKPEFFRRLAAAYCRYIVPARLCHKLCRNSGVYRLGRLKAVPPYIRRALTERLRVAYNLLDVVHCGAFNGKQILHYFNIVNSVNIQRTEKGKVHNLTHITVVAVFNRKNNAVVLALFHRFVCRFKIFACNRSSVRENTVCGNIGKRALNAAVGYAHTFKQPMLIRL